MPKKEAIRITAIGADDYAQADRAEARVHKQIEAIRNPFDLQVHHEIKGTEGEYSLFLVVHFNDAVRKAFREYITFLQSDWRDIPEQPIVLIPYIEGELQIHEYHPDDKFSSDMTGCTLSIPLGTARAGKSVVIDLHCGHLFLYAATITI